MRGEVESALADTSAGRSGWSWWSTPEPATGPAAPSPPVGDPARPTADRRLRPGGPVERTPARPLAPIRTSGRPEPSRGSGHEDIEDLSAFDESELGEVADVDNSAESRVLQAFPGAEEVG